MKKRSFLYYIIIAVFTGTIMFILLGTVTMLSAWLYKILIENGIITAGGPRMMWAIEYSVVCTLTGSVLSVVAIHRPAKKMARLLEAMEKIASGDFSVRLRKNDKPALIGGRIVRIFNNMAQQLESTEMLNHDFINNFSHEFKTPIASINGFAKLLKDDTLTAEERNEYLDIIIQESERLSGLSTNILNLSRLEKQSILTNKTVYNVTEQLRIATGSLYHSWSKKNIEIDFLGEDCIINANHELMNQVWLNLLDNAIKFSPEGETIYVRTKANPTNTSITIENRGSKIPKEEIDRIFDKFYQGDRSHSTNGNGLGLPLVKRITELHGGKILAQIRNEENIAFTVVLPSQSSER